MADTRRVLVVEDERNIWAVITEALIEEGCDVRSASNGREALEIVLAWKPDAILCDLMMPVMDGWAFREAMRDLPNGLGDVPLIVLSGTREVRAHAEAIGAAGALPKPFDLDEVVETVEQVLRRHVPRRNGLG